MSDDGPDRLLPVLPDAELIDPPEEIDRLAVRLSPGGLLWFNGTRRRVEEFLFRCAEAGLDVDVDHASPCG